jgi:DNA-directed RNA polymerase sigma subunit (sigma70/sigma32)
MDKEHTKYLEACKARRLRAVKLKRKGLTLKEIGTLMGITRERVRQIVARESK